MKLARSLFMACALAQWPATAGAQAPTQLLNAGIAAYRDLDFQQASELIGRALGITGARSLDDSARVTALTYFGAAERYLGRPDSALAVFRTLVRLDPRHQPDELIFPPEITVLYRTARRAVPVSVVEAPGEARFVAGTPGLSARIVASTPHEVTAEVRADDGRVVRTLYGGPVADSLDISWDARDAQDNVPPSGRYFIRVVSQHPDGRVSRVVQVPLDLRLEPTDTLAHPPAPAILQRANGGWRALAVGLALGTAVAVGPSLIAPHTDLSPARFGVGVALATGGVLGLLSGRRVGDPLDPEVSARRRAWEAEVQEIARENAERRRSARVHMRSSPPLVVDAGP